MRTKSLLLALLFAFSCGRPAIATTLITPAEAALPSDPAPIVMRGITRGPTVVLVMPHGGHAPEGRPLAFEVQFKPHNGTTIDLGSVRVTYLKNPEVDLTPRLKPYITQKGIALEDAELPAGNHAIRVDVKDSEGRESDVALTLTIGP